tara:strand:- start:226 stop:507 length:282 start_codon:yes stop_codon:yes gene_type:complete
MLDSLNKRWKQFLLNERYGPEVGVWVQSLKDNINMLRPRSVKEDKRLQLMKHQLNEIRKATNRLQREMKVLQEENQLLQEKQQNEQKNSKENK